jgi:hypothetical protein
LKVLKCVPVLEVIRALVVLISSTCAYRYGRYLQVLKRIIRALVVLISSTCAYRYGRYLQVLKRTGRYLHPTKIGTCTCPYCPLHALEYGQKYIST